jgi:hypothetical protein
LVVGAIAKFITYCNEFSIYRVALTELINVQGVSAFLLDLTYFTRINLNPVDRTNVAYHASWPRSEIE